jgi:IPT/TIG domain/PKD domain
MGPPAAAMLGAAVLIAAVLVLSAAPGADAVIVRLSGKKTVSYMPLQSAHAFSPLDELFSNLDYNGGPIMPSNTNYAFLWLPPGDEYPPGYQAGVETYFKDLAHDSGGHENTDSVSAQFNDAAGEFASYDSDFGGGIVDTHPYPTNGCNRAPICLTDAQLQGELKSYIAAHELPTGLTYEYFIITPPGVEDCFTAGGSQCSAGAEPPHDVYCAYHGNIPTPGGQIIYANDPYVTEIEGCDDGNHPNGPSDGLIEGGLSHEHNESITDPEPNNAWTDIGGVGGEIADKCQEEYGQVLGTAPDGAVYNQVINGDLYWYQELWSNQEDRCMQHFTLAGEEPTATFTSKAGGGTTVTFDASESTAPGGVFRYNWQFNDGKGGNLSNPVETSTPTVTHEFPSEEIYNVALTVFASNGTSIGTAHNVAVGALPPPRVTRVAPKKGPTAGGTTVTITGSGFIDASAVSFGSASATKFTVVSNSSITAVSPATSSGIVDVRVTTPVATSEPTTADHFKYEAPTVTKVSPNEGPAAGGTEVTVTGTGFALAPGATVIKFAGSVGKEVKCASLTSCTVTSPRRKAGVVEVRAVVAKLTSPKDPPADQFTYR